MKHAMTVGMATYNDFDGVYFTIQAVRMYHEKDVEFIVVDNYGCKSTQKFVERIGGKYILDIENSGTAYAKNLVFEHATGDLVVCLDCHVLVEAKAIKRLRLYFDRNPDCFDLIQGPLVYDELNDNLATHFNPVWSGEMFGVWATNQRVYKGEPFEIPMQGMGLFACKKAAWPGFNPRFRGFGGEEWYIHEKFRQAGRRCICMPWLKWLHRFERPSGVPYAVKIEDKLRNYLIGWSELGLDITSIIEHFADKVTIHTLQEVMSEALRQPLRAILEKDEED